MGHSGANRAFSQRNRDTLQQSQQFEKGQDVLKELYKKGTIDCRYDVNTHYSEAKRDNVLNDFQIRIPIMLFAIQLALKMWLNKILD